MVTPEVLTTWKYSKAGFALYLTTRCDGLSHRSFKSMSEPAWAKPNTCSADLEPFERLIATVVSTVPVPKPLYTTVCAFAIHVPSGERDSLDHVTGSLHPVKVNNTAASKSAIVGPTLLVGKDLERTFGLVSARPTAASLP